jgi:hypothetical protein
MRRWARKGARVSCQEEVERKAKLRKEVAFHRPPHSPTTRAVEVALGSAAQW